MNHSKILLSGLGLATTLSMVACGPATNTPTTPATSTPSVAPTVAPSAPATTTPSTEPSAVPTPVGSTVPSSEPTAVPSASVAPTAAPSASATATPLPAATSDISVIEKTTFNGKIFDDTQSPLDGVTVKVKSLNSSVPYEAETITAGGTYAFNNAPSGVQVEIVSSKAGFTTRKRVEVLKSNKQGDPNANRYDFGNDGSTTNFSPTYNALSDKPEVTMVTPARNGSGVDPKTSFVLKFSEPMDRKTAEDTFTVRAFTSRKFTVDNGNLRAGADNNTVTGASNGVSTLDGSQIWDKDAFNISWNSDDTEATFSFKEEKLLPTDKDSNLVPDYQVGFRAFSNNDRVLKDKSGISRDQKHFKLTDGDFEESYKFAIKPDEVKPTISSIIAQTDENAGSNGDAVAVRFSERMIIYTRNRTIAGGMENVAGADSKAPAGYPTTNAVASTSNAAKNYSVRFVTGTTTNYTGTWAALGGTAVYDTTDVTHKTVLLLPPVQARLTSTVAARPANLAALDATYALADGTSAAQAASTFFLSTSSATATGARTVIGATSNVGFNVIFFRADGTFVPAGFGPFGGNATLTTVVNLLNSVMTGGTGWSATTTNGGGNGAVIAAGDQLTFSLASTAQFGGVNVAVAVIRPTGIFAAGELNAPPTGLVVVSGAPSLASFTTVTAGNALNDVVSVDFRYTDGTSETVSTAPLVANAADVQVQTALNGLMTGNTGWTVSRALSSAALAAGDFLHVGLTGNATRNGKTVAAARLNATDAFATNKLGNAAHPNGIWVIGSDALQTQHLLNSRLLSTGGLFTVTEQNTTTAGSMARIWDAGDQMTLALATGAKVPAGTNIMSVTLPQTGLLATGALNAPTGGFIAYPGTSVNGKFSLYKPGDTVRVEVAGTVLDPAGNTVDTGRNNASANAS